MVKKDSSPTSVALAFVDCINRGNLENLVALMSDDHRLEVYGVPPVIGREANTTAWRGYLTAFPRYAIYPRRVSADGGRVAILGHTTGSHLGLPDAEEREMTLIWVAEVRDGALECWRLVEDTASARTEFGLEE